MNIVELLIIMVKCLILTIIIEVSIGLVLGIKKKKDILTIIKVNVITNPIVVSIPLIIYHLYPVHYGNIRYILYIITLVVLEILTFVFEGFIYKKKFEYKKLNPFYISLLLNLSSYLLGKLITSLF